MSEKFDPRNLTTLSREFETMMERSRTVHLHLGYNSGLCAALDLIREHLPTDHPVRKGVFDMLMEVKNENVAAIIETKRIAREQRMLEHRITRSVS